MRSLIISVLIVLVTVQGCSVHMALNQPEKVDVNSFAQGGMSRDMLIARFGLPVSSTKNEDGTRSDVYEFYEGSEPGWKYGRATFNLLADIVTICLWELIAWPTEAALRGSKIQATAPFDKKDILVQFNVLGGKKISNESSLNLSPRKG
ncbi:MAG: hypothetical protein E8D46_09115 [Nitrospira sp.]|nr:MAG: hypothetical protein E8D46_09115 [Nitrospira sp.]